MFIICMHVKLFPGLLFQVLSPCSVLALNETACLAKWVTAGKSIRAEKTEAKQPMILRNLEKFDGHVSQSTER